MQNAPCSPQVLQLNVCIVIWQTRCDPKNVNYMFYHIHIKWHFSFWNILDPHSLSKWTLTWLQNGTLIGVSEHSRRPPCKIPIGKESLFLWSCHSTSCWLYLWLLFTFIQDQYCYFSIDQSQCSYLKLCFASFSSKFGKLPPLVVTLQHCNINDLV